MYRRIISFCVILLLSLSVHAQNNYQEAMQQGDAAVKRKEFKLAIDKYFAAEAFAPSHQNTIKEKVKFTFNRIEELRQEAIRLKKHTDSLLLEAQHLRDSAERATLEQERLKNQALIAERTKDSLRIEEKKLRKISEESLKKLENFQQTVLGSGFQGGIVISWADSTGKKGVIASKHDLGSFTWKEALDTCDKLILEGYDDWRLPDRTELAVLYAAKNVVGGFNESYYWSRDNAGFMKINAWCALFRSGFPTGKSKNKKYSVRAVRTFTIVD